MSPSLNPPRTPAARSPKSIMLDLAYQEYCDRVEAGETFTLEEHLEKFPHLRSSLRRLIDIHHYLPRAGIVPSILSWPRPGQHFQGLNLLSELGRGTFGHVYLATQPELGGRLAVAKVTSLHSREAMYQGRLQHRNIVPVHSVQIIPPYSVLCMPYLGMATLCDVLDKAFTADGSYPSTAQVILEAAREEIAADQPVPEDAAAPDPVLQASSYPQGVAHLGAQLADALAAAHRQGIYHRDLKPSNVLLTPGGRPLLLDFNLSQDAQEAATRMGGTPAYMAPEQHDFLQALNDKLEPLPVVDHRADIYSLGVVLYELLTGRLPTAPHLPQMARPHLVLNPPLRTKLVPVRWHNPNVPAALDAAVMRCLKREPHERWYDAAELAAALHACVAQSQVRRRRWRAAGVAAALLLAGTLLTTGAWFLAAREAIISHQEGAPREAYERGLQRLNKGEYTAAYGDFKHAYEQAKQDKGKYQALMGYCMTHMRDYPAAIVHYANARMAGYEHPAVLNNLGYAHWKQNQYDEAVKCFDQALKLAPNFDVALHNRAVLEYALAVQVGMTRKGNLDYAARLMEKVLQLQPHGERYMDAGRIYAVASQKDRTKVPQALQNLQRAVELGQDPKVIQRTHHFQHLREHPQFQEIIHYPRKQNVMGPLLRHVNPVGGSIHGPARL